MSDLEPWVADVYDRFSAFAEQARRREPGQPLRKDTWLHCAVSPRPGEHHPINITLLEWTNATHDQRVRMIQQRGAR